ncbi:MAG: single-stranded DNA-binding protein [Anaerolineales bacterium]|nr:single-stranded DNA-binding protein [Anaerolineales bacterium]
MPQNNFIYLSGNLADDPYFEMLSGEKGKTPYIRFDMVVERDSGQGGPSSLDPAGSQDGFAGRADDRRADLIRVTEYGVRARIDFFFLKKGAHVAISGWLQSRRYFDRGAKRMRRVTEVNAQKISYGRGCDFERGERQRLSILAQLETDRASVPADLVRGPIVLGPEDVVLDPA